MRYNRSPYFSRYNVLGMVENVPIGTPSLPPTPAPISAPTPEKKTDSSLWWLLLIGAAIYYQTKK